MHPAHHVVILLFALLGHGYLWIGIVNRLHGWAGPHKLIDVLTLAGLLSFLALPFAIAWQWWVYGASLFTEHGLPLAAQLVETYVLVTAFFGLGNLLAKVVGGWGDDDPQAVVSNARQLVVAPPSITRELLLGVYPRMLSLVPGNQVLQLTLHTKRLVVAHLPAQLAGLRIVHVSDFHLTGRIGQAWFDHVAHTVDSVGGDVIMITGDLIEKESCRAWLNECLGRLRAKYGVYFVLGNHDFYVDADRTIRDLVNSGLVYVGGKSTLAEWNGYPVLIAGNEVPWRRELADLTEYHARVPRPFRVLLMHTPDQFDWACESHADLALAGHTHGGQVCFPVLGAVASPSRHGTRFAGGTFQRGRTVMHVTRGISGETPIRWLCPPEIAVLELVSVGQK